MDGTPNVELEENLALGAYLSKRAPQASWSEASRGYI